MKHLMSWPHHRWLAFGVRLYLGLVFMLACLHKLAHPATFAVDVATYQLLPLGTINLFALVVPWVELLVGILLITGVRARAAAVVTAALMVAFMVALGWALAQGLEMSCGCFASQSAAKFDPISWRTMLRDAGWLALATYVICFDHQPFGLESLFRKSR